jgi:predicted MFS family arabinose efflux permease
VFEGHRAVMLGLGIAALAGGIAFYGISFLLLERDNKRNFRALATFGLFLVLAGIFLPFSRSEFWILACACALGCCWAARAFVLPTLGLPRARQASLCNYYSDSAPGRWIGWHPLAC